MIRDPNLQQPDAKEVELFEEEVGENKEAATE